MTYTSLVFVLCHGYQWYSIEKSGEPPICLFNNYQLPQKQMWQTYISICSIFRALQDAVAKTCICQTFKYPFDIPTAVLFLLKALIKNNRVGNEVENLKRLVMSDCTTPF